MSDLHEIWRNLYEDNSNNKSDDGEGMDKVQPKALKKDFKDRKDKDIDNDGDVDDSDEYIDNKRKTVSKAIKKDKEKGESEVEEAYNKDAVDKEVNKDKRIKGKERKMIHALLKGHGKSKTKNEGVENVEDIMESAILKKIQAKLSDLGPGHKVVKKGKWYYVKYPEKSTGTKGGSTSSHSGHMGDLEQVYDYLMKESVDLDEAKMEDSEVLSAAKKLAANGKDEKAKSFGQGLVDFYKKNDSFTPDQVAGLQNIMKNAGFQLAKEGYNESTDYVRVTKHGIRKSVPAATLKAYVSKGWEEVTESVDTQILESVTDAEKLEIFDAMKKGQVLSIKFKDGFLSTGEGGYKKYVASGKPRTVGKAKVGKVTLTSMNNPNSVKCFLYNRNGKVSFAMGNSATQIIDMKLGDVTESVDLDENKNAQISAMIKSHIAKGKSVEQAVDAVLGKGVTDKLKTDVYHKLRKKAGIKESVDLDEMKQAKRKTTVGPEDHMPNAAPNDKRAFREHPIKIDDTDEKGHQDSMKAGSKKAKLAPPRRGDNTVREFAEFLDSIQIDESSKKTTKMCPPCGGTGVVHHNTRSGKYGSSTVERKCKECKGKGKLNESVESFDGKEIADLIEKSYRKYFPKGLFYSRKKPLGGSGFTFTLGLIGDKKDVPNGIEHNDPMRHVFMVNLKGDDFEVTSNHGSLSTNPPKGSHMAMHNVKTKFRKVKGDEKKIVVGMDRFFSRLKSLVKDNKDNIYGGDKIQKYLD